MMGGKNRKVNKWMNGSGEGRIPYFCCCFGTCVRRVVVAG
jgi:hypothetical protein